MDFKHVETGICGLSCRLCPRYNTTAESRCGGCKSQFRMGAGCPFVTCAVKKKGIELCTDCAEITRCDLFQGNLAWSNEHDTFVCRQRLGDNVKFIQEHGIEAFEKMEEIRGQLLTKMIGGFDDGRSKSFYCIAATVLDPMEIEGALATVEKEAEGLDKKERAKAMRREIEKIADMRGYHLKLRK